MKPRVTVFIPTYNRVDYLRQALGSALAQRFESFEVLVVDDRSTDATLEWLACVRDPRLRVAANSRNLGIAATHNRGLELVRGEYLAFLDSDEWAAPDRLARQVAWLDAHPRVGALGSAYQPVDALGRNLGHARRNPRHPADTAAGLLFHCAVHKPTVTARTAVLRRYGFARGYRYFDDHDLWARMAADGQAPANLPQVLGTYRKHGGQTTLGAAQALEEKKRISARALDALGVRYNDAELCWHVLLTAENLAPPGLRTDAGYRAFARDWLLGLLAANARARVYAPAALRSAVAHLWFRLWQRSGRAGGPGVFEGMRCAPALAWRTMHAGLRWRLAKRVRDQLDSPAVLLSGSREVPSSTSR